LIAPQPLVVPDRLKQSLGWWGFRSFLKRPDESGVLAGAPFGVEIGLVQGHCPLLFGATDIKVKLEWQQNQLPSIARNCAVQLTSEGNRLIFVTNEISSTSRFYRLRRRQHKTLTPSRRVAGSLFHFSGGGLGSSGNIPLMERKG